MFQLLAVSIITGLLWWQRGRSGDISAGQDIMGLLFFELLFPSFRSDSLLVKHPMLCSPIRQFGVHGTRCSTSSSNVVFPGLVSPSFSCAAVPLHTSLYCSSHTSFCPCTAVSLRTGLAAPYKLHIGLAALHAQVPFQCLVYVPQ